MKKYHLDEMRSILGHTHPMQWYPIGMDIICWICFCKSYLIYIHIFVLDIGIIQIDISDFSTKLQLPNKAKPRRSSIISGEKLGACSRLGGDGISRQRQFLPPLIESNWRD